jgi:hypothetical protein
MKLAIGLVSLALAAIPSGVAPIAAAGNESTCPEAVQIHHLTGALLPPECAAFDTAGSPAAPPQAAPPP